MGNESGFTEIFIDIRLKVCYKFIYFHFLFTYQIQINIKHGYDTGGNIFYLKGLSIYYHKSNSLENLLLPDCPEELGAVYK